MKRMGMLLRLKPEAIESYKEYHAAVWPEVLDMISECNVRNYSIYLKDDYLFGYFEYHGSDIKFGQPGGEPVHLGQLQGRLNVPAHAPHLVQIHHQVKVGADSFTGGADGFHTFIDPVT